MKKIYLVILMQRKMTKKISEIRMLIPIDLDGTLINTVHPSWRPFKDEDENYIFNGKSCYRIKNYNYIPR